MVLDTDGVGWSADPTRVHGGGNGGYQMGNIAMLMGAARILLLGIDVCGGHWHAPHPKPLRNPDGMTFRSWMSAWETVPATLPTGVEVINCSPGGWLECFPRVPLEDVL